MEILPKAMVEMQLAHLEVGEAARLLANHRALEILRTGEDPLRCTREFERMWMLAGYLHDIVAYRCLHEEVSVARLMGRNEQAIRNWLIQELKELANRAI
jgi:hypothetical protein